MIGRQLDLSRIIHRDDLAAGGIPFFKLFPGIQGDGRFLGFF